MDGVRSLAKNSSGRRLYFSQQIFKSPKMTFYKLIYNNNNSIFLFLIHICKCMCSNKIVLINNQGK